MLSQVGVTDVSLICLVQVGQRGGMGRAFLENMSAAGMARFLELYGKIRVPPTKVLGATLLQAMDAK
jgi:hypothetical protein